jgi:flavin reductase (DIM6/NTAB) family NADH-FMN oxidoreductase RutF
MKRSLGARTLAFTTPVWVIATYDEHERPNAMTASWAGICCSRPPSVNVSLRKATYTYECLTRRGAFTVNVPSERHVKQIDYLGLASGRDKDKLAVTGLTPVRSEIVDAPYVEEFPLVLECRLASATELGLHTMFVGEILDVKADESVLDENGMPDVERVGPLVFSPEIRVYHGLGERLGKAFSIGQEFD